ncbi:MAG: phage portal protein [Bacteroidales bacterium]|nr:phage portal protein [Candidatus Scybalousia scybalohippi]
MKMVGKGRKKIIDDREINEQTIVQILTDALAIHRENVVDINSLIDYYKGQQTILNRPAPSNSEINNKVVLNYAYSSERDIMGYTFGKPIQIIPRKTKARKAIKELTDLMEYENTNTVDNEVALFAGITGVGYFYTLPSEEITSDYMPDVPISLNHADPTNTFVIQSAKISNPVRMSVNYWCDKHEGITHFVCYTDSKIYRVDSKSRYSISGNPKNISVKVEKNLIGLNPIQMVSNNLFMMGDFEVAISVLDALNQLASDSMNDVQNVLQSLLVIINAELEEGSTDDIKKNRILEIIGSDGKNVDAKFIYQQLDAIGANNLREYLEEAYKVIIGIPDRKTRGGGGGDTGDAVKLRDGWADIEVVARVKESYFKQAKKKQVAVIMKIMKELGVLKQELKLIDIDIKFPRNKTDNLQSKAQSYSTFVGTRTIAPEDALEMCDVTTDVVDVANRGKEYWDKVAEENMAKEKEMMQASTASTEVANSGNSTTSKKLGTNYTNNQNKVTSNIDGDNVKQIPSRFSGKSSDKEKEKSKRTKSNV